LLEVRDKKEKLRQGKLAIEIGQKKRSVLPAESVAARREKWVVARVGQERRIVGLLSCRDERKKQLLGAAATEDN